MRIIVVAVVAVAVLLGLGGSARAGSWYYRWSCSGACAPSRLAISGVEGPYGSYDTCERVRQADSRNQTFIGPGNLGGTSGCTESDAAPAAGDPTPVRVIASNRFTISAIAGSGWRMRNATGEARGEPTYGAEIASAIGGRPYFGLQVSLGIQSSEVTAPGAGAVRLTYVPLMFGLLLSPSLARFGGTDVRLDLGADGGFTFRVGCADCDAMNVSTSGLLYSLRAGLAIYRGPRFGVGIASVFTFGKHGDIADEFSPSGYETTPPTVMFRLSLLARNPDLAW